MHSLAKAGVIAAALITGIWATSRKTANTEFGNLPVTPAIFARRTRYPVGAYPRLVSPDGTLHVIKSLLNTRQRLHYGDFLWDDAGVPPGPVWVRIDLKQQTLSIFRGGDEIGSAVILYGTDGNPTPTGTFPVLQRAALHRSTIYDAEMPYMLRLTQDGVALHASNVRAGAATHGCIGIPPAFAKRLFEQVQLGDIVEILPSR